MADYIYLLENRLSVPQRQALRAVRELARTRALTIFLVGGAVRDLTSGSPVRDLDVVIQGNVLKLRKDIEKLGATVVGESEPGQALFLQFPGAVRMELGSTLSVTFPKPGKPVARPATILEDLRRRDFTANAMALSLNEGSYGLLMDPLNGVADIENRQLRLVSGYGFIEDPVRMVRAARLMARLGWSLDERTQARYETGKQEGYIAALSDFHRGYETEEIAHEEDPLRVLRRLENEGWMQYLAPFWTSAKVNVAEMERLREVQAQLQMQGLQPNTAAANFQPLTAKLTPREIATLKESFPRQGFVREIEALEGDAREFTAQLTGKQATHPSHAWKLITSTRPEVVLWVAYASKSPAVQAKFKSFFTEWPLARQKMPYTMMQEMRIVPELPGYDDLLEKLFFELMDGKLTTPEEMKAFLEPFSPPAPPPPVSTRRLRAPKKDAKPAKSRAKKPAKAPADDADSAEQESTPAAADVTEMSPEAAGEAVEGPVKSTAAKASPAKASPAKASPAKASPAKTSLAKAAPAKSTPAKAAQEKVNSSTPASAAGLKEKVSAPPAEVRSGAKTASATSIKSAGAKTAGGKSAAKAPAKSMPVAPQRPAAKSAGSSAVKTAGKTGARPVSGKTAGPAASAPAKRSPRPDAKAAPVARAGAKTAVAGKAKTSGKAQKTASPSKKPAAKKQASAPAPKKKASAARQVQPAARKTAQSPSAKKVSAKSTPAKAKKR